MIEVQQSVFCGLACDQDREGHEFTSAERVPSSTPTIKKAPLLRARPLVFADGMIKR
jgi:hypothetical protein